MEDLLISTLESFGYPVKLQGSLLDTPYPDSFFTFWEDGSNGTFTDNDESHSVFNYSVNFYSVDVEILYSTLLAAKKALRDAGFCVSGDGYSVPSDVETHDGRGLSVSFLRNNTIERNDI